jgi:GNAT superfamily N-acetyltransferase
MYSRYSQGFHFTDTALRAAARKDAEWRRRWWRKTVWWLVASRQGRRRWVPLWLYDAMERWYHPWRYGLRKRLQRYRLAVQAEFAHLFYGDPL